MDRPVYKRILLKLSGEAFLGDSEYGIDVATLEKVAEEVKTIHDMGVEIGIVIGGGNIYRGLQAVAEGIEKVAGDYMGMLATVINSLAFQCALEKLGVMTRLQSAIKMEQIAEPFIRRRAMRHLEKQRLVIFGAGTGNPYFTTDTAAALRAIEINATALVMAKNGVDGIYDADPRLVPEARRFASVSYSEVHRRQLRVMDLTAITLCQENRLPILVYDMNVPGNLRRLVTGEPIGTRVHADETTMADEPLVAIGTDE